MKAIILAAGLGSRLGKLTKNNHKSLIKIGDQSILERLINQFHSIGIKDINIICGYQKKKIIKKFPNYKTYYYPHYKKTNNLHTLYFFRELLNDDCLISFADIILQKSILKNLSKSKNKITLSIDTSSVREGTMKIDINKNKLLYLGNEAKIASGNYIGIMKIKKSACKILIKSMKSIINKSNNFYFTESINRIIDKKIYPVNYQDVKNKFWIEIDDMKDLILARKKIKRGKII
jgi:choline kinase